MTSHRRLRTLLLAPALAGAVLACAAAPANAQASPPTTAPPVTAPPVTEPPTTAPPPTLPPTTIAAPPEVGTNPTGDPVGSADAGPSGDVPGQDLVVPPKPATTGTGHLVVAELKKANDALAAAQSARDAADARVADFQNQVAAADRRLDQLSGAQRRAARRYAAAKQLLAQSAVDAYMGVGSNDPDLAALLRSTDANGYGRRREYARSSLDAAKMAVDDLLAARRQLSRQARAEATHRADLAGQVMQAVQDRTAADLALFEAGLAVQVFAAGSQIFVTGFVFPVADPHQFVDSFGAPRLFGTASAHYHEGCDIMAPAGTPMFATEHGVISKMGSNTLGGIALWLKGQSGTSYYYAHLTGYAPGLAVGQVVDAGTVVGFVGNTGDAAGGPTHLHFEIHPNGGPAVDPYPILKVADDVQHGIKPSLPPNSVKAIPTAAVPTN